MVPPDLLTDGCYNGPPGPAGEPQQTGFYNGSSRLAAMQSREKRLFLKPGLIIA